MSYDHNDIKARIDAAFRLRGTTSYSQSIIDDAIEIIRSVPIPMRLPCPECHALHIDVGEFATKPHHTHACQLCGNVWRPAIVPTVGVRFLPGFRNAGRCNAWLYPGSLSWDGHLSRGDGQQCTLEAGHQGDHQV